MKHMSHPSDPDTTVEAPEDRAIYLEQAGWDYVKPGPAPKDDKS